VHSSQFVLLPFEPIDTLDFDADKAVSDIHDRMIVGVARRSGATLLTRDEQIVTSGSVTIIW
jgi:hypothetical protein